MTPLRIRAPRVTMRASSLALFAIVVIAALIIAAVSIVTRASTNHVAAYFRSTTGLYVGDRIMVLGVQVGSIDSITPEGDAVRIDFTYDNEHPVPADARAAIIAPTLVTGRYIQLAPVYEGGATLSDGDTIPVERTAVPVEFDEVKEQVVKLARDVGASPDNPTGALNQFVTSTANALDGNGQSLHDSLVRLSDAVRTVDQGGGDLFTTLTNLQQLTTTLAENDHQITQFSGQLSELSGFLNNNRTELDALLSSMETTFNEVTGFIEANRDALKTDVDKLNTITGLLVDRQDTLASVLHTAPTALSTFYNIYDPQSNSLTGALAVSDMPDPKSLICALLSTANAPSEECARAGAAFANSLTNATQQEGTR